MDFNGFRDKFTDEAGHINEDGKDYFQNKAKGLISYLNREYDPTTFAQPKFHQVIVPVGAAAAPDMDEIIDTCTSDLTVELAKEVDNCADLLAERDEALEELKALPKKETKGLAAKVKAMYKTRVKDCKAALKAAKRGNKKTVKELLKAASACYRKTKKTYTAKRAASQMIQMERCVGKPQPSQFMPLKPFKEAVVDRLMNPIEEIESANAVITE
jgi:aminopeptidase N